VTTRSEQSGLGDSTSTKPTLKEVAKLAGVSFKTVSRVLNEEPHVSAELQERVKRAAWLLNYERNETAAQLRRTAKRPSGSDDALGADHAARTVRAPEPRVNPADPRWKFDDQRGGFASGRVP
jgi:transcriptional regulator with XRE-family HTH domain